MTKSTVRSTQSRLAPGLPLFSSLLLSSVSQLHANHTHGRWMHSEHNSWEEGPNEHSGLRRGKIVSPQNCTRASLMCFICLTKLAIHHVSNWCQ